MYLTEQTNIRMVSSTNQKRARSKSVGIRIRRIRKSATAAAEPTADIEAEVDGDADESVTPTSPNDTPPLSDFDEVEEEDSSNVEKSVIQVPTVDQAEDASNISIDDK